MKTIFLFLALTAALVLASPSVFSAEAESPSLAVEPASADERTGATEDPEEPASARAEVGQSAPASEQALSTAEPTASASEPTKSSLEGTEPAVSEVERTAPRPDEVARTEPSVNEVERTEPRPDEVAPAASKRVFSTSPVARPDGSKWRIGYYESGDYEEYPLTLQAIAEGLQTLGWLKLPEIPEGLSGLRLWLFLSENAQSDTLEFVREAYWKPGNFDERLRAGTVASFEEYLKTKGDLDLVIAMGTWAGQDLARLGAPIPVIVASTSNPLESEIIASPEDSGLDNLHARVYPGRYRNQVRLFRQIVPFRTLGIVYEDSPEGRSYAALADIEEVAEAEGFSIVSCHAPFSDTDSVTAMIKTLDCYRTIAPRVDAIYVTTHRGITSTSIWTISALLRRAQTPSFSMLGSEEVKAGILMSLVETKKSYLGLFHAEVIARVFNGAKPRELNQFWADPAKIALNLETTRQIGFDPPVDILLAADEVYETRENVQAASE